MTKNSIRVFQNISLGQLANIRVCSEKGNLFLGICLANEVVNKGKEICYCSIIGAKKRLQSRLHPSVRIIAGFSEGYSRFWNILEECSNNAVVIIDNLPAWILIDGYIALGKAGVKEKQQLFEKQREAIKAKLIKHLEEIAIRQNARMFVIDTTSQGLLQKT